MTGLQPVIRINRTRLLWLSLCLLFQAAPGLADEVHLQDGSRLMGDVVYLQDGTLTIETDFAGRLEISADRVSGISLDNEAMVTLNSGDRLRGTPRYTAEQGQRLIGTLAGEVTLSEELSLVAITDPSETDVSAAARPEPIRKLEQEHAEEVEQLKEEHAARVTELEERQQGFMDPWSGSIALGINGASGNSDHFGVNGRAEARRATNGDRLMLYLEGSLQEENSDTTANEVLAGGTLERDINRDWFVFGNLDFEKDEFEDLELRAVANAGIGYFLARSDAFTWKALVGAGYQHETFTDNSVQDEAIVSFGYDLNYHYNEWLEFLHKLTYFPSITSPTEDYRLVSNLAAQMPVGNTENWKLRLNLRNQYDSMPRPGIEDLDTVYSLNLVYDFE